MLRQILANLSPSATVLSTWLFLPLKYQYSATRIKRMPSKLACRIALYLHEIGAHAADLRMQLPSTPGTLRSWLLSVMARTDIHVLCFGASITAGWSSYGQHYYPYATRLSARLADELPTSHFGIDVDGSPGDTVLHGQYVPRLSRVMSNTNVHYDWVIIQAGGNDLGWNRTPEQIFQAMKALWSIALNAGTKVLALTVTEHAGASPKNLERMKALNELISSHQRDGFFTADIAKAIPYTDMPEDERKKIWDDGLHLTKEGMRGWGMLLRIG